MLLANLIKKIFTEASEYSGEHEAPDATNGKPIHNVIDIYPEDFYSGSGYKEYAAHEQDVGGSEAYHEIINSKDKPYRRIWVYRAAPKGTKQINAGDWVTPVKRYAQLHGKENLNGKYVLLKKHVDSKDLFTDGNSIVEWGYDPQPNDQNEIKKHNLRKRINYLKTRLERMKNGEKIISFNKYEEDPFFNKSPDEVEKAISDAMSEYQKYEK